jgi:hypothetical protein
VRDDRRAVGERLDELGEGAAPLAHVNGPRAEVDLAVALRERDVPQPRIGPVELREVVVGGRRADEGAHVAHRRHGLARERAQLVEVRAQPLRHRLRGVHERVQLVEREAQVHVRRVRLAHELWEAGDRLGEGFLLVPERPRGGVEVPDQGGEVVAPLGQRGHEARRVHEEALEHRRVVTQLLEQARARGELRAQVLEAGVRLVAASGVLARPSLVEAPQRAARGAVEDVEELVEVDLRGRVVRLDDAAVRDVVAGLVLGGQHELHVAAGHAGEAARADDGASAVAERGVALVHLHRHLGLAVGRDLEVLDEAGLGTADVDVVPLDELAAADEAGLDGVATAGGAIEKKDRREGTGQQDGNHCRHARQAAPRRPQLSAPLRIDLMRFGTKSRLRSYRGRGASAPVLRGSGGIEGAPALLAGLELALDLALQLARLALRVAATLLGALLRVAERLAQVLLREVVELALELARLLADVLARRVRPLPDVVLAARRHGQRERRDREEGGESPTRWHGPSLSTRYARGSQ